MKVLVKSGISWGIPRATTHCIYFLWFSQCMFTVFKGSEKSCNKEPLFPLLLTLRISQTSLAMETLCMCNTYSQSTQCEILLYFRYHLQEAGLR